MAPQAMTPGTVLGGRYRLDVLLADHAGARFWRATDTVLVRSVAVHAISSGDPRSQAVLEAARLSATVSDPHFLRALDCDDDGERTWVINEWGQGTSLDLMLQERQLPPSRAAWLAREVAEAVASAHAQGVHHGRLNPEAVLVTDAGAVKVIGSVINRAFEGPVPVDPLYGLLDDREADVINLAGILYAALVGKWPGVAPSLVPPAPREGRRPSRPRQVRAGVPRTLDAICERVLHKEASQHVLPIETALETAAALSDFVGDPAAAAPMDVPSMYSEPTVPLVREQPEEYDITSPTGLPIAEDPPRTEPQDPAPQPTEADTPSAPQHRADPTPDGGRGERAESQELDPRPLFAEGARRVPANAPAPPLPSPSQQGMHWEGPPDPIADSRATGEWPFESDPADTGSFSGRRAAPGCVWPL